MEQQPIPRLDPEKLKVERHDADLGATAETGHGKMASDGPDGDSVPSMPEPTSGATPPAR